MESAEASLRDKLSQAVLQELDALAAAFEGEQEVEWEGSNLAAVIRDIAQMPTSVLSTLTNVGSCTRVLDALRPNPTGAADTASSAAGCGSPSPAAGPPSVAAEGSAAGGAAGGGAAPAALPSAAAEAIIRRAPPSIPPLEAAAAEAAVATPTPPPALGEQPGPSTALPAAEAAAPGGQPGEAGAAAEPPPTAPSARAEALQSLLAAAQAVQLCPPGGGTIPFEQNLALIALHAHCEDLTALCRLCYVVDQGKPLPLERGSGDLQSRIKVGEPASQRRRPIGASSPTSTAVQRAWRQVAPLMLGGEDREPWAIGRPTLGRVLTRLIFIIGVRRRPTARRRPRLGPAAGVGNLHPAAPVRGADQLKPMAGTTARCLREGAGAQGGRQARWPRDETGRLRQGLAQRCGMGFFVGRLPLRGGSVRPRQGTRTRAFVWTLLP